MARGNLRGIMVLLLIMLLSTAVACGREPVEKDPPKPTPVPNSLAGQSLACGIFPTSLIAETTNLPLDQLSERYPNKYSGGNGEDDSESLPGDCSISYAWERIPRLDFTYGYLSKNRLPPYEEELNDYNLVVKNPERVPLPPGVGKGYFAEGYGSYAVYPCEENGEIYVQLIYSDKSARSALIDAMPFLRMIDKELKRLMTCI